VTDYGRLTAKDRREIRRDATIRGGEWFIWAWLGERDEWTNAFSTAAAILESLLMTDRRLR